MSDPADSKIQTIPFGADDDADGYTRLGHHFRQMPPDERRRVCSHVARHMASLPRAIQLCEIFHFFRADPHYGSGVAKALGIDLTEFLPHGTAIGPRPIEFVGA